MSNSAFLKRFCIVILAASMIFLQSIIAYSVNIDGFHNGDEWNGSITNHLLNGESNSNVNNAFVKTLIRPSENAVYFCFMFIDPTLEPDNVNAGVLLSIENTESFGIYAITANDFSDNSEYSFEGAVTIDDNNGAVCEIRVGFKNGLPQTINANVRFADSEGNLSNNYRFSVINSYYVEPTELIITETQADSDRTATQKVRSTKARTTAYKEEKKTDYTLKPKTTVTEKEKTEFYIRTSPPYSYVRKTKAPKTTKAVVTSSAPEQKTAKPKAATVYYYEKEVIISEVYITDSASTSTSYSVTQSQTDATDITVTETELTTAQSSFSLSKGTKYKAVIGLAAVLSFTGLAIASSYSSKKK